MSTDEEIVRLKAKLAYYGGWDVRMSELEAVKDAARALLTLHDDPDPAKREAGKRALWDRLRAALVQLDGPPPERCRDPYYCCRAHGVHRPDIGCGCSCHR